MNINDKILFEDQNQSKKNQRLLARERLVYNATEDLLVIMERKGISKIELSKKIGKSRSYITQILSGARNMTLGSLSDICFAIDIKPKITFPMLSPEVELTEQIVK